MNQNSKFNQNKDFRWFKFTTSDSLLSVDRKEREAGKRARLIELSSDESDPLVDFSMDLFGDESDSSGDGTRFAKQTGIFT